MVRKIEIEITAEEELEVEIKKIHLTVLSGLDETTLQNLVQLSKNKKAVDYITNDVNNLELLINTYL